LAGNFVGELKLSESSKRGGTDQEREKHGKMTREEAGRKGGQASNGGGRKKEE